MTLRNAFDGLATESSSATLTRLLEALLSRIPLPNGNAIPVIQSATQAISGTVTANQGTGIATGWNVNIINDYQAAVVAWSIYRDRITVS